MTVRRNTVRNRIGGTSSFSSVADTVANNLADVAELADAADLGSVDRKVVEVRVLSSAQQATACDMGPWPSGKAPPLHGGDRRFESDRVHLFRRSSSRVATVEYLRA